MSASATMTEKEEKAEPEKAKPDAAAPQGASAEHLIEMLTSGKETELKPVLNAGYGCRYPEVEKLVGNVEGATALLERLVTDGILTKKLLNKSLSCPNCHSPDVATLPLCPHCKSFDIAKHVLLEHLKCGYIGPDVQFRKEGKLLCPKCNAPLVKEGEDYRRIGVWFECHECKKRFSEPLIPQHCRSCGTTFQIKDADLMDCYSYVLSGDAAVKAKRFRVLSPVVTLLKSAEYGVESPGKIQGKSGGSHIFDVVAARGEERLLIDVVRSEGEVDEQPVITMFAKMFDLPPPSRGILVAIPNLNKTARQLTNLYQITVVEGKDAEEVTGKLRETLKPSAQRSEAAPAATVGTSG